MGRGTVLWDVLSPRGGTVSDVRNGGWWGQWTLDEGAAMRWSVGNASLWVGCRAPLLLVGTRIGRDPLGMDQRVEVGLSAAEVPDGHDVTRFAVTDLSAPLRVTPRLADRPIIARPETAFELQPQASVRVFVSTPLWAVFSQEREITEVALHRASDTWFGATPLDGELCYAVKTALRARHDDLPRRPHRAITPIHIRNSSDEPLRLKRLRLPVPFLSVLRAADGTLWTETVEFVRRTGDEASVRVVPGPPAEACNATVVGAPRAEPSGLLPVLRAFNSFLS
jgi:hypothetical protein